MVSASVWPLLVERLQATGEPWDHAMMVEDLAWWDDRRRFAGKKRPGRGALQKRWRCNEWDARKALRDPAWRDRGKSEEANPPEALQRSSRSSPEALQVAQGQTPANGQLPPEALQKLSSDPPEALLTRVGTPTPSTLTLTSDEEGHHGFGSALTIPSYVVAWTRTKPARSRPKGITQQQLVEFIVAGVEAITGKPPAKVPGKSYGRPLLNLWARLGFQPFGDISECDTLRISPGTALGDVRLLSDACRRCPADIFRNHLRGVERDGTRWRDAPLRWLPAVVCRLDPKPGSTGATIEDRLAAAREWDEKGRPAPPDDRPLEGAIVRRRGRPAVETVSQQMRRIGLLGGKG